MLCRSCSISPASKPHRGVRLRRLGQPREAVEAPTPGRCHVRWNGLDLHAGLVVPPGQRERLERVCRYALRPPVTPERLAVTADGQVRLELRQPWADGTTQVLFEPVEFLGRLAVLVPRPRVNLILYYGVLGARAAWRSEVVPRMTAPPDPTAGVPGAPTAHTCAGDPPDAVRRRARGQRWAEPMRRTFGFEVLACPRCGGRLRLIALIEEAAVIDRILRHLGLPTDVPVPCPARARPAHRRSAKPSLAWWMGMTPGCASRAPDRRRGVNYFCRSADLIVAAHRRLTRRRAGGVPCGTPPRIDPGLRRFVDGL